MALAGWGPGATELNAGRRSHPHQEAQMIREILEALFLDSMSRLPGLRPSPAMQRLAREQAATDEAAYLTLHDMQVGFWQDLHRTFRHHHDQSRARHAL